MLVSEYVTIPLRGMNVKRYEDMGYIIPRRVDKQGRNASNSKASLLVKVKDLSRGSEVRIDVMCDYCGEIKSMQYCNYVIQLEKDIVNKDCCIACRGRKIVESNLLQYGVKNPMQLEEVRKKQNDSNRADTSKVKADFVKMGFIPLFDNYTNDRDDLPCRCENHIEILQTKRYSSIKAGEGCKYCSSSKGEVKIQEHLTRNGIRYIGEYSYEDLVGLGGLPLRFDFAILNKNNTLKVLIEYDGIFHYEKQYDADGYEDLQIHDKRKNQYCKDNNIPLIRIPYWQFGKIEQILDKWLGKYGLTCSEDIKEVT